MSGPGHEMILASAGSGKTHALTHRYIRLLAAGAAPERIVALTFTRKAAGEFFDEILEKLAQAAGDPARARQLGRELGYPNLGAADLLRMLRQMVEAMPGLSLGTLDGFFARVVRAFPSELGVAGDFQVLEETPGKWERRRVLRQMFSAAGRPNAAQAEFIEAFKRATFGTEEKRLGRVLDSFLDSHREIFFDAPLPAQWGAVERIWPEGCPWLAMAGQRHAATEALQQALATERLDAKQRVRFDDFFAALLEWTPGATLPKPMDYILRNAFEAWPQLNSIRIERKAVELSPAARTALRRLLESIVGADYCGRLEMTRGLFEVLRGFEKNYDEIVRRSGKLTFADVLQLLRRGPRLSGAAEGTAEERRLAIDWRLDGKFDHWLLDEFQDTSRGQWSVLQNLIDEAVQDADGKRSLFYVGDVKQAIFSWRGGDTRLFREIFDTYNEAAPGTIAEARLDRSWRSGPAVIEMVNRVFGRGHAWQHLVPPGVAERWQREWRDHESARPKLTGATEVRYAKDEDDCCARTLDILREICPWERGLDVAILVRTNEAAGKFVEYLRAAGGIPVVTESDELVAADNPLSAALLALLRAAAYPDDSLAQQHLNMTPLAALLHASELATADKLSEHILAAVHEDGVAGVVEEWLTKLRPAIAHDAFSMERGQWLVSAAAEFDASGSKDIGEFLEFAEMYTRREVETQGAVRVMTIHKAKGLGFDIVILPDLDSRGLVERRGGLGVRKGSDQEIEWVLELPPKIFAARDPVLATLLSEGEEEGTYENLCLLYVAMTRAKRAMYVVMEAVRPGSEARNFRNLLERSLGHGWKSGDARWYVDARPAAREVSAQPSLVSHATGARSARRVSRTPSGLESRMVTGAQLFALDRSDSSDFGHVVHELFAKVEWVSAGDIATWARDWSAYGEAADQVIGCLEAPALAEVWARRPRAQVWRERPFEVVHAGAWVTGTFDRVTIEYDEAGAPMKATVIDFKTDRVADDSDVAAAVERHQRQLNLYREVVAILAGIPISAVTCELILTRRRQRLTVNRA